MQQNFDLTTLNGANGFTVSGISPGQQLGSPVGSAGDLNADGIDDIVLGLGNDYLSYVIFGSRALFQDFFNVSNLNGTNGFTVGWPGLGDGVNTVGDINGDGISDLALGRNIIFGSKNPFPAFIDVGKLNGTNGFQLVPYVGGFGVSVSSAGDVNGDGLNDLVIGSWQENSQAGAVYVIFGSRVTFPALFNVTNLNSSNGFKIPGFNNSLFGCSVSGGGDINGDGLSDLVVGAYRDPNGGALGAAYVIFGNRNGFPALFNLTHLNGTNGFMILASGSNTLGLSVATAGDINADGISDLVVGDPYAGLNGGVVFGSRSQFDPVFSLWNLNGTNGFTLFEDAVGISASMLGDVNDDGIDDLVLGSSRVGSAFVIFGSRLAFPQSIFVSTLNGTNGFIIPGPVNSSLGSSVSSAGDFNGDGLSDILLGAPGSDSGAGAAYLIFGKFQLAWLRNQLTITEGQTVPITFNNLNATVINNPSSIITFTVSSVTGGRFTFVSNSTVPIFYFNQTAIATNQIQFVSDRSAPVSYNVNATDGQSILPTTAGNVTFINHAPQVLNIPATQTLTINQPFDFSLVANDTFMDSDGDPLTYSAKQSDGSVLPSWLHFDNAKANQLHFNGTSPSNVQGVVVNLFAVDPLNASTNTQFQVVTVPPALNNNGTSAVLASTAQIAGGLVGGVLGLGALLGAGFGFWRYAANKNTRKGEQFADLIRVALNLKGVGDFDSEVGHQFVGFVHGLQSGLKNAGVDIQTMRPLELEQLADDVANAARNKISSATDCFGRSVITVDDLQNKLQDLLTEVQVLRSGGAQERSYTV